MNHWINLRNLTGEDKFVLAIFCAASAYLVGVLPLLDLLQAFVAN